jgi:hypothetical protein
VLLAINALNREMTKEVGSQEPEPKASGSSQLLLRRGQRLRGHRTR